MAGRLNAGPHLSLTGTAHEMVVNEGLGREKPLTSSIRHPERGGTPEVGNTIVPPMPYLHVVFEICEGILAGCNFPHNIANPLCEVDRNWKKPAHTR